LERGKYEIPLGLPSGSPAKPAIQSGFTDLFQSEPEQIDKLKAIGPKLLKASPRYQCLLEVLVAEHDGRPSPDCCPVGAGIFP